MLPDNHPMQRADSVPAPPRPNRTWAERVFGRWWRRQSAARQDRYATLGPLLSVLLFLAAHRLRLLVPEERGVRSRAGGRAPRHRGRPATDAPAPDREPRAADADGARAGHPHARPRRLPGPGRGIHARASRGQQPHLAEQPARPHRRLLGDDLPARDRGQRRRHPRLAAGREVGHRCPRKPSSERARRARQRIRSRSPTASATRSSRRRFRSSTMASSTARSWSSTRSSGCCATSFRPRSRAATPSRCSTRAGGRWRAPS